AAKVNEYDETKVVRCFASRIAVEVSLCSYPSHTIIEWQANRLIEIAMNFQIPLDITGQRPVFFFHRPKYFGGRVRVSGECFHLNTFLPKSVQITHVILIGIGDKEIIETVSL